MRKMILALAGCLAVLAAGCGPSDQPATVAGTVLMDGQPLPEGEILFEAADKKLAPVSGPIVGGKYRVETTAGLKKVKIRSSRPGKPDPVMGMTPPEARLGPEYDENTTLSADLKAGANEGVDFQVKEMKTKK